MTTPGKPYYDRIYLSPHLDDAVLSCGGQIYQETEAGRSVLIVSITAGEPQTDVRSGFAQAQHHNWGVSEEEVIAVRRAEDIAACHLLGAEYLHWPWPDCIYRLDPASRRPLYRSDEDIFGEIAPAERPLINQLAAKMDTLPPAGEIIIPLTVGNHVDHQLTRAAAERHFDSRLLYYEDYPYVQRHPELLAPLVPITNGWHAELIPLTEAALTARTAASRQYRSQISQLFDNEEKMASLIRQQVTGAGGERIWRRSATDEEAAGGI